MNPHKISNALKQHCEAGKGGRLKRVWIKLLNQYEIPGKSNKKKGSLLNAQNHYTSNLYLKNIQTSSEAFTKQKFEPPKGLHVTQCVFQHGYILLAELCSSQSIHLKLIYYSLHCCWKSLSSLKFASQGIVIDRFTQHMVTKRFTGFSQATSIGIGTVQYYFQDQMLLKISWVLLTRTYGGLPDLKYKVSICSEILSLLYSVSLSQIFNKGLIDILNQLVQHFER